MDLRAERRGEESRERRKSSYEGRVGLMMLQFVFLFGLNLFDHRSEVGKLIDSRVIVGQILLRIPFRRAETLQASVSAHGDDVEQRVTKERDESFTSGI